MEEKIFERELEEVVSISKEFGADKVLLFGSCLEDIKTARDIDIAVSGIKPKEFFGYYGKVSIASKDEVDIVDLDDIREHFYKRILSKGRIIYERSK
ncbi:MAG: nucleotidyltransferase domain-containing protein [Candidatus Omnitrophica bacterium]|nr:nucleotidyltransferase domain-containing protein [Candidatus Omnitrophota bacterium]MBU0897090.1 nucleotidyltransferase domain-containing protein [Candidatus Omnitrophota bacterium]MBU1134096.1 nucleotidyltransferase domain-containing protein [Candidatus Omnitrophota bacterium]MBU1366936.1 nucleotidyltransferase domain-containing protein [Candidatus Omnitrophota bacterium]MBU1523934.1 nucleotidyltransferase domain-containing protein [Candidatus Omnitrophota bacterium]